MDDAGDAAAFQFTEIDAQRGDAPKVLDWLKTACLLRDPGLGTLKISPLIDSLRKLNFPK